MQDVCDLELETTTTTTHASSKVVDEKALLPAAPTPEIHSLLPTPAKVCYPVEQVSIDMYMYHYVRPTRRDAK
jgi:hypothetical protein